MNILHAKYALEVAKSGSISKASEKLFVAVPNISRSIKELESELGICIFERYPKGVKLTREGEIFINHAKNVLNQIDYIDSLYQKDSPHKKRLSISVPQAFYISEAFSVFSSSISESNTELIYKENDAVSTIKGVYEHDYHIGIIRYPKEQDNSYKKQLEEKSLQYELIADYTPILLVNKDCPLAQKSEVYLADLKGYTEVVHSALLNSPPLLSRKNQKDSIESNIFVSSGGIQYNILQKNSKTYAWSSPVSEQILDNHNLVQLKCMNSNTVFKDVLIYRKGYELKEADNEFIKTLHETKNKLF